LTTGLWAFIQSGEATLNWWFSFGGSEGVVREPERQLGQGQIVVA